MAFPTGTTEAPTDSASGEERIDSLLSGGTTTAPAGGNGTDRAAEDTSVADADFAPEQETTEQVETEGGESSDEEHAGAEEHAEPSDFELTEQDADFSVAAYARAAAHYSKQSGKTLDPNDPGDRFLLSELMKRGQRIKKLQSAEAETEDEEKPAAAAAEEVKPVVAAKPTIEQIRERVKGARQYAKENIVPEVAMEFAKDFMEAMWPGKGVGEKISQEQATRIAEVFSTFAVMQIADAIPSILSAVPTAVTNGIPMMGRVLDMASRESAIDEVLEARDKGGAAAYPDFEKLVENGTIKQMMASDELKSAVFNKDPQKNLVAKLKFAYKLAKGQRVDVGALEKASERGRQEEKTRTARVAAGKLPPGNSRGSFAGPVRASNFINTLVSGSGSKFSRAIAESKKN